MLTCAENHELRHREKMEKSPGISYTQFFNAAFLSCDAFLHELNSVVSFAYAVRLAERRNLTTELD